MVEPDCSTHTNYNSWYTKLFKYANVASIMCLITQNFIGKKPLDHTSLIFGP